MCWIKLYYSYSVCSVKPEDCPRFVTPGVAIVRVCVRACVCAFMPMCTFLAIHMRILHFTLLYVCCVSRHTGVSSTSSLENCNAYWMLCGGCASATGLCPQLLSLVSTLYCTAFIA